MTILKTLIKIITWTNMNNHSKQLINFIIIIIYLNINIKKKYTESILISKEKAIFQLSFISLFYVSSYLNLLKWKINVFDNFFIYILKKLNLHFICILFCLTTIAFKLILIFHYFLSTKLLNTIIKRSIVF